MKLIADRVEEVAEVLARGIDRLQAIRREISREVQPKTLCLCSILTPDGERFAASIFTSGEGFTGFQGFDHDEVVRLGVEALGGLNPPAFEGENEDDPGEADSLYSTEELTEFREFVNKCFDEGLGDA